MTQNAVINASEAESRALAESSREESWTGRSFMRQLFLGELRVDWISPYPQTPLSEEFTRFYAELERFLQTQVDSAKIDREGEYGQEVIDGLRQLGVFGMKIDKAYGGLGFNQVEYCKAVELLACYDGNLVALVSAHLSIGLPQPLKLFGTDEQKARFLPRCAAGAISAFALTEPDVGSDPARLATRAELTPEGDWLISGEKLWITNGTAAELMIVMARSSVTGRISAFIVDMASEGVEIGHRCRFMGLRAIENGVIRFHQVRVPKENLVGKDGEGLKIALITLNTGRLSLPAATVGAARRCLEYSRTYAAKRVQWGAPVGHHEAISHKLADMATLTFAIESWSSLANELAMRDGYDIRLEAASAKEWCSVQAWKLADDCLQIKGGRGYETETSLKERGEEPDPVERMFRDSRINRIFEGSSEIMHLFMAREMVDQHLQVAGALLDPKVSVGKKLGGLPKVALFYGTWYPRLWWGLMTPLKYGDFGELAPHLRFAERRCRKLARNVFHGMVWYQAKLEKKQVFLFRTVDIAMALAVMVAAVCRAHSMRQAGHPDAAQAVRLADQHGRDARFTVDRLFTELWRNDDASRYALGKDVTDGSQAWLELAHNTPSAATPAAVAAK